VLRDYRGSTLVNTTTVQDGITHMLSGFKETFEKFNAATEDGASAFADYVSDGLATMSESDYASNFAVAGDKSNSISRDDVEEYAATVAAFVRVGEANCAVGKQFGIAELCNLPPALEHSAAVADKLAGVCSFDSTLEAVQTFCATRTTDGGDAPRSAFDALSHLDRLVTFSGTAAVDLEYSIGEGVQRTAEVGFAADSSNS
jgi:hypothetical protein